MVSEYSDIKYIVNITRYTVLIQVVWLHISNSLDLLISQYIYFDWKSLI